MSCLGPPKWLYFTVLNPGLKPLNFIRIKEFELFGAPKWLNFTVLNPGLKPLNFIRIVEFELFGTPKWLKLTVLNPGLKPLNFIKIAESKLFGAPKWLNFTVLNPGLKPLNFIKITEFELFGAPKWLNLTESRPETLQSYQNRRIWAVWGAKMAKVNGFESRPETLEFYQNRRIWAVWGAKMAKFNGFESRPETFEFYQNHRILSFLGKCKRLPWYPPQKVWHFLWVFQNHQIWGIWGYKWLDFENHQIWGIWGYKWLDFECFEKSWRFETFQGSVSTQNCNRPKCECLPHQNVSHFLWVFQNHQIWGITKFGAFGGISDWILSVLKKSWRFETFQGKVFTPNCKHSKI